MTFGQLKSIIEEQLLESYKNKNEFKEVLKDFKKEILNNKNTALVYSLYEDLSKPQGLTESDARVFLDEGIELIRKNLTKIKLPKEYVNEVKNKYQNIDDLVYVNGKTIDLNDRLRNKKSIFETLIKPKEVIKESVNIPISSMVKVANQTLKNYLENIDESDRKNVLEILQEDTKSLKIKFQSLKEDATKKLTTMMDNETSSEVKLKISETIQKIKNEKFDQLSYLKLKNLVESI